MRDFSTDPMSIAWKEWGQKLVVPPPPGRCQGLGWSRSVANEYIDALALLMSQIFRIRCPLSSHTTIPPNCFYVPIHTRLNNIEFANISMLLSSHNSTNCCIISDRGVSLNIKDLEKEWSWLPCFWGNQLHFVESNNGVTSHALRLPTPRFVKRSSF